MLMILYSDHFLIYTKERFSLDTDTIIHSISYPGYYDYVFQTLGALPAQITLLFFEHASLSLSSCLEVPFLQ